MKQYKLRNKGGNIFNLGITPTEYDVVGIRSGKKRGEVTAWNKDHAGEKIAKGKWKPKH